MSPEWAVVLDGAYLSGGDGTQAFECPDLDLESKGCLTVPPDGLGLPDIRTEDVTYPQRDGVRHFADWYGPRIVTLENVQVTPDGCADCPSARVKARDLIRAWGRKCDDAELVIYTDCHGTDPDRSVVGPFGVIGRPRVATLDWRRGRSKSAVLTLRFDAVDHRMYILDECGTPGSGGQCVTLTPDVFEMTRCYDRCYTEGDGTQWCYDTETGGGGGPIEVTVDGTECVPVTITLCGQLTSPVVENLTTGEEVGYADIIPGGECIIIDTETGRARTQDGADRTYLLTGNPRMGLQPGENVLRLRSFSASDNGTAEVCWRPAVISG